jgi:hypothetical protein
MTQEARIPETIVRVGTETENRLPDLDLTVDLLLDVVRQGEYARAEATANDPLPAGGMDAYRYRVRGFRDRKGPDGWTIRRERGLEITVSPTGSHALITRAGDAGVGLLDGYPQPKGKIGDTTCDAVDANASLLLNPNWMNATRQPANDDGSAADECQTWMLLVYREGDVVRSELSLPSGVEETATGTRVLGWVERLILPALDFSNEPTERSEDSSGPVGAEPTVVRKR